MSERVFMWVHADGVLAEKVWEPLLKTTEEKQILRVVLKFRSRQQGFSAHITRCN